MKVACLRCNKKKVEIKVNEEIGYIEIEHGTAVINNMTDGVTTVDFYCSDECKDS
jgi:hypothetical protein